jgi:hypothetical protein
MDEPQWLSRLLVDVIHSELIREHGGSPGTRAGGDDLIEAAISRPHQRLLLQSRIRASPARRGVPVRARQEPRVYRRKQARRLRMCRNLPRAQRRPLDSLRSFGVRHRLWNRRGAVYRGGCRGLDSRTHCTFIAAPNASAISRLERSRCRAYPRYRRPPSASSPCSADPGPRNGQLREIAEASAMDTTQLVIPLGPGLESWYPHFQGID